MHQLVSAAKQDQHKHVASLLEGSTRRTGHHSAELLLAKKKDNFRFDAFGQMLGPFCICRIKDDMRLRTAISSDDSKIPCETHYSHA
jgi:hypothetical protein